MVRIVAGTEHSVHQGVISCHNCSISVCGRVGYNSDMRRKVSLVLVLLVLVLTTGQVLASSSTNYQIQEDDIGGGGSAESNSANFSAQDAFGDAAFGNASSADYDLQVGPISTNDPTLTFVVNSSSVNLGALSTSATKTATATFSVLNYTSYGYIVQVIGNPPSNGAYTLAGMTSPAGSQTGVEQFGINLKNNSSPDIGAEPQQVPDGTFSSGSAASGYNTADSFKYVSGNTIAQASQSSGRTDYTMSYIANISINTPGGSYAGNQTLVVTGTY